MVGKQITLAVTAIHRMSVFGITNVWRAILFDENETHRSTIFFVLFLFLPTIFQTL